MSQIKTTEIEGDVAIGRHVTAGGNATIQGNTTVKKNLKVEGWLDARNIKGPNKGIFLDVTKLREAYPLPHDGWWALVGNTLPAPLYIADGGAWVATGESAGNPTIDSQQYNDAVAALDADLKELAKDVSANAQSIEQIRTQINTIGSSVNTLTSDVSGLKTRVSSTETRISTAEGNIQSITNSKGMPNGIASLDAGGKVPSAQLPGYVDDVVEFNAMVSGVTPLAVSISKNSTDIGCMVVYDTENNVFLLAVSNRTITDEQRADWINIRRPIKLLNQPAATIEGVATPVINVGDFWDIQGEKVALIQSAFTYYNNWLDGSSFGEATTDGRVPEGGKVYISTSDNKTYRWSGSQLVIIGNDLALGRTANTAFPGDAGALLENDVTNITMDLSNNVARTRAIAILPFDGFYDEDNVPATGVWFRRNASNKGGNCYMWPASGEWPSGFSLSDYNTSFHGFSVVRDDVIFRYKNDLYRYDGKDLVKVGGASVGNTFNLTAEIPTPDPDKVFYTMNDKTDKYYAPAVVVAQNKANYGLQITFAVAHGSWKIYQYVGTSLESEDVLNSENWLDLAGMSAGAEAIVNVNEVCEDKDYTMSLAIQALIDLRDTTGVNYLKAGLIITYRRDSSKTPHVWETKQFVGQITDISATNGDDLWPDFGGGGGLSFDLSNEPEINGTKALSTGGAYDMEQRSFGGLQIEPDPTDYIIQAVSKAGNPLGDSVKIPKSNGGGQSGSTLTIYCESAVWGAFGSKIMLSAAIKSVTYDGEDEVLGTIRSLSIIDPTTDIELWSEVVNQPSSTSANDLKFSFDFTDFITAASSKDYKIKATDADGNERTRIISVTAVDVTCTCVQTLNYSAATALEVGGREKSLPMYKFENNVSTKQGILVTTEMFYSGAWRTLGTATITDQYSHNISIDPNNVFGNSEKLAHGSYPLRIQGKDLASGVTGNTIYTAVMCVDASNTTPIVVMRYDDRNGGKVRLYDSIALDVAAYTQGKTRTAIEVVIDGHTATTANCEASQTLNVTKQIQGYASDGSKSFDVFAKSGTSKSSTITLTVEGSAIDAEIKEGALFAFDFSTRNNSESDHTIEDNGYTMNVIGSNWNSNGFVSVLGENVLRIAENVKAEIPYAPFSSSALETSGAAIQLAFSTKSIKDRNAMLCECYDPAAGVGFYIRGNEIVLTVLNGTPRRQRVGFKCGEKITVAVVVEPGSKYVTYKASDASSGTNYSFVKLYVNGEECAAIGYQPGTSALRQNKTITFNSENGDFNLNYFMPYSSYMEWLQAFRNYLCKLSNVNAMIAEYDKENVLDTTGKPSMSLMSAKGIPYYVIVADQTTFNNFDYALNGGTSTSDQFACTLYYFNPQHPECNFKAVNVLWRRQGTTSAQRPIKNDRFNFNKKNKTTGLKATVTLLNPDDSTELGRKAILAAKHNKVYVSETGMFVDVVTVKVDYSDSSNANDCGVCDLMNATFRALGSSYMTPAQRAYDGTQDLGGGDVLTGLEMDHSTKNHPIACFRATTDTLQDAWFHAKGNWKEDKGEQVALGFKDTPGYNKGCLNYGDFVEYFGTPEETLAQTEARFIADPETNTEAAHKNVYLISQYCGRDYAIYRYKNGAWTRSTGSMKQVNGRWVVTGDVLNPVSGYELLQYAGMDWWQGVATVEDMMKPSTQMSSWVRKLGLAATEYPAWTYYFECMIDDDQLQEDLALGKKVPYDLFNMLRFFNSCDYSRVTGWEKIWRENAYRYMSLESAMAYTAFTDYLAAVDQRAKNMQPMFFLEDGCSVENGVYSGYRNMEPTRMYLNKVYDCDTCNGADNDGGRDIDAEINPNKMTDEATGYTNPYMGYGSVLFNNMDRQQECWNSNDLGVTTISLKSVVNRMRNQTAQIDGKTMVPFSPDGALYFFVEKRLLFWPKVISSYDGERKYIDHTGIANLPYFYALHGLGLTTLPRFIEQRWAIRDGYYQTGDFFTNPLSGRVSAIKADSKIYITAAASGYFGIGNDASGQLSESVFLEAGESHAFTSFAHDAGALLYIYQTGRMSKIDLSEMSLAFHFDDLSKLQLAEEIILGGDKHTENTALNGFNPLGNLTLGDMPFLRIFDVSNTTATGIDAKGCPRIESINASNTPLTTCDLAQTSPIETLKLPASVTKLELVNLPRLTYPGGLTLTSVNGINRLWVEGCDFVDVESLVMTIAEAGAIREVRIPNINMTASVSVLRQLRKTSAIGLDATGKAYEESGQCSGITGRWILSELIEDADTDGNAGMTTLSNYFPELDLINSQFSLLKIDDIISGDFCERYSNPENQTGADYNKAFAPSGHTLKIKQGTHAFKCTFNSKLNQMEGVQLSDTDFGYLNSGESFDNSDQAGEGFDIFHHLPHHWYKGVNDYKNQKKYILYSTTDDEPLSTVNKSVKAMLSELLYAENTGVYADEAQVGETIDDTVIATASNTNAYRMDVEGMKQVRWPGLNHARLGAVFTDADGKIVGSFIMQVSHTYFDFSIGNYIFCDVPSGAKWMYFTSYRDIGDIMCLAVDSSHIEAIEPEWTEHTVGDNDSLIGTYPITIDGLKMPRSLSGAIRSRKGDGNSTTSSEWAYDSDGNPTETPVGTIHYTAKDFQNSTRRRGAGYQLQDYEQHKEISNLWWALSGTTNEQAVVGNGAHDATLNGRDSIGMADTEYVGNAMNSILGLKHYVGCDSEWMDYIACNVRSYAEFYKNRCLDNNNDDPIDYKAHIYDPVTKTERVVQTVTGNGNCVVRVVHGAKCDILASKVHQTDTSKYTTHYAAGHWLPGSRGRVVLRSGYNSYASGGLAYAIALYASSNSYAYYGGRLAFRGKFVIVA
jgi:hypothetical protein